MGSSDKFCLRWNDFESNISSSFRDLRQTSDLFDVSIAVNDINSDSVTVLQAHKVILASCSPLFRKMLSSSSSSNHNHPHPLIYLKGIKVRDLSHVLDFMYHGEVNVAQADLDSFLAVAEELKVKGLTERRPEEEQDRRIGVLKREAPIKQEGSEGGPPLPPPTKKRTATTTMPSSVATKQPRVHAVVPKPVPVEEDDDDIEDVTPLKPSSSSAAVSRGGGISNFDHHVGKQEEEEEEEDYGEDDDDFGQYEESGDVTNYDDDDGGHQVDGEESVPGTSDGSRGGEFFNSLATQQLGRDIVTFMTSMSSKSGGGYQCLVCSKQQRDLFNLRTHMMRHMVVEDTSLVQRLDGLIDENVYKQSSGCFSCLVCKQVVRRGMMPIRAHFIMKHLEVIQ